MFGVHKRCRAAVTSSLTPLQFVTSHQSEFFWNLCFIYLAWSAGSLCTTVPPLGSFWYVSSFIHLWPAPVLPLCLEFARRDELFLNAFFVLVFVSAPQLRFSACASAFRFRLHSDLVVAFRAADVARAEVGRMWDNSIQRPAAPWVSYTHRKTSWEDTDAQLWLHIEFFVRL